MDTCGSANAKPHFSIIIFNRFQEHEVPFVKSVRAFAFSNCPGSSLGRI
jgi:hypothetical protein